MFKKVSPVVLMLVVTVVVVGLVMMMRMRKNEGFNTDRANDVMDDVTKDFLAESSEESNSIKKEDIEKAAKAAALQFCPVPPDYNPSLYIRKTEIEKEQACPKVPNMKDYVLKSSIPPPKDCPPCICPKVNVSAGLCKDGEKEGSEVVCPPPKPCGTEECAQVVKCPPPPSFSSVLDDDMVTKYVNELVREKDYRKINKMKNLLDGVETPSDIVSELQEENDKLRQKIRKLEMRVAVSGGSNRTNARLAGMMSNKRTNTNSPVVEYNQKCQNNRANNWYDISGIIGSAFNSNTAPSNAPSSVPANNVVLNSVNSKVDAMMNNSNAPAASNNVLENFH